MATICMRFPNGRKKALTLSYDDGVEQDIRLINIMKKHGLKGTFNLNAGKYAPEGTVYSEGEIHRRLSYAQATEVYKDSGMEVAIHGYTHPHLEQLPLAVCMNEIAKDRESLEKQFHKMVRGAAYPFGTFNDDVINIMKGAGIVYGRPVIYREDFALPQDWFRWQATCKHTSPNLMELAERFLEKQPLNAPLLFYLWGHSYEFDRDNNWEVIERFAEYVGNRDDIWYATNLEIYEYIEAYKRLVFSIDGNCVYNPTLFDLYFEINRNMYCIHPGEYIVIDAITYN